MRALLIAMLGIATASVAASAASGASGGDHGIAASHVPFPGAVGLPVSTVAGLPTCGPKATGVIRAVSDASSPTFGSTLTGGSTTAVIAFCNGTNWVAY